MSIYDGQQYETNQVHYLRRRIAYTDDGSTLSLGWVPFGAVVIRGGVAVTTAFNAGTTNVLDIGFRNGGNAESDSAAEFATDLALGTAGVIVADEMATADSVYFPKGAEITCSVDLTGAAATAGVGYVWVEYLADNDGDTSS